MTHLQHGHAAAGALAIVGIVVGLWSASGYVAGFMRAANVIYDVPEGRPVWKTTPVRLGVTLLVVVLLAASIVIVTVTGGLASRVGHGLGIGSAAVTAWEIAARHSFQGYDISPIRRESAMPGRAGLFMTSVPAE